MNRAPGPVLILALLVLLPRPGGATESGEPPVVFRKPDERAEAAIASAIGDLGRQQLSDRTRGREALAEIGYWAVEPLLDLLREGDANEIRNATLVLGEMGDRRAVDPLLRVAGESSHQYLGAFAVLALGRYRDVALLPRLGAFIQEGRRDDRRIAAVLAVTKTGTSAAWEILVQTLRREKLSLVREAATFCLGFFREQALVRGPDGRRPIPEILESLRSRDRKLARAAMIALALLGHRDLKPIYLRTAEERGGYDDVREVALLALGRFPDPDVTELLLRVVEDDRESGRVQLMAAFLLKDRRDPAALARLKKIDPRGPKIRAALTLALSNFEDEEVARVLTQRLTDQQDQVRAAAAIGLSRLVTPALRQLAIARLTPLLEGKAGTVDPDVGHNMRLAREILRTGEGTGEFMWLGNREFAADLEKDVEEKIVDMANHEAYQVLGLNSLTDLTATGAASERFRVNDEGSELRDLKEHLDRYPYFAPTDIPEPKIAVTPRDREIVGAPARDGEDPR